MYIKTKEFDLKHSEIQKEKITWSDHFYDDSLQLLGRKSEEKDKLNWNFLIEEFL